MTIEIELSPGTKARLAAQAAAHSMDVSAYAARLLEEAAESGTEPRESAPVRYAETKSLAQLFAESPFKGLDLDFERDQDTGHSVDL